MLIMGVDPGYAIVGYGVVSFENMRYRAVCYGAVTTMAGENFGNRLVQVYDGVSQVLSKYRPDAFAIEKLFFNNNQKTAVGVAEARGVILLAAQKAGVMVYEYTPLQVKTGVTGYGRAQKPQVMEMTRRLLNLNKAPKPDDICDALAIAICHGRAAGTGLRRALYKNSAQDGKVI